MMFRWLFLLLVAANVFPVFLAGNNGADADVGGRTAGAVAGMEHPGVKSIMLVSESSDDPATPDNDSGESGVLPQRRELRCFLIGPLPSMAVTEKYAGILENAGLNLSRHWRETAVGSDYWVYLPRLPSTRATTRTLQELKASDIDGFIFSEGELKGAIALAVFTTKVAAEEKMAQLQELGYDAKLGQTDRNAREYWLMSESVPRPGIMVELMNTANANEIPQKISRMDCKTVASAMQFQ